MTTTEERLENGIKHQPDRYFTVRNKDNKLIEVRDKDTGRLWVKISKNNWGWVD
jgi:hypothetical protein